MRPKRVWRYFSSTGPRRCAVRPCGTVGKPCRGSKSCYASVIRRSSPPGRRNIPPWREPRRFWLHWPCLRPRCAVIGFILLPFTMGAVSGQGGPGYTFIAAEPRDESLIPNQLEVTLVHEFGHYLHLTGMPREDVDGRRKWRDYLAARRMDWRDDGGVNTAAWARSPEETFAEDFRLLFGGRAAEEPAATAAGDPRLNDRLARRLRQLMRAVAADVKAPADPAPWPEEDEAWMAGRTAKPIFAVIPLGILLGLGIRRLPCPRVGNGSGAEN